MGNNWINIIQHYLFPPTCILCGNEGFSFQDICQGCFNDLTRNIHCCYRCAEIFNTANTTPQLCGQCISNTPAFDETYAPFTHQGIIRYLIAHLKFNKQYKNARLLGMLLAEYLARTAELPELIIPIPLHKIRFQQRGFNQSFEIAKTLSKQLNIPLDTNACIRYRNTPHQIDLPAKQRHKNIKNAFKIIRPIKAQHIAIFDDVMTTGTTVNELAKIFKKSGVSRVDVWVCARA
ncbi:MAG: ComF family protein [Methylococcales bacterium]